MKVIGNVKVGNGVRLGLSHDLGRYYSNLVYIRFGIITCTPAYGVHVTIINPQFNYKFDYKNWQQYKYMDGKSGEVEFNPEQIYIGGWKSNFLNFWVKCNVKVDNDPWNLGRRDDLHLTFCSTKFDKGGVMREYNGLHPIQKKIYYSDMTEYICKKFD